MMINKKAFLEFCIEIVQQKLGSIQEALEGYKKDLHSETKSSAGDKHETGRAMLQLEMEKLGQQHLRMTNELSVLKKISVKNNSEKVQLGCFVTTNLGTYFIATSLGAVAYQNQNIFVISINSPIGKLLLGKQRGEFIFFQGKKSELLDLY